MVKPTTLLLSFLLTSTRAFGFHLNAQVYHNNDTADIGKPLYVTRYGYLTLEIGDADDFDIDDKQQLVTFPGKARSRPVGVFNTTLRKNGYAPLTSLVVRNEVKITTNFTTYESDSDDEGDEKKKIEIIAFENDVFQDGEAIFMARKPYKGSNDTKELEGQQIFVLGDHEKLDSDFWRLVDLVVVRKEEHEEI